MTPNEMRNMTVNDLQAEFLKALKELFNIRMQKGANEHTKLDITKKVKKEISRIKTILKEKEG